MYADYFSSCGEHHEVLQIMYGFLLGFALASDDGSSSE
jgi:hypothetical protein